MLDQTNNQTDLNLMARLHYLLDLQAIKQAANLTMWLAEMPGRKAWDCPREVLNNGRDLAKENEEALRKYPVINGQPTVTKISTPIARQGIGGGGLL